MYFITLFMFSFSSFYISSHDFWVWDHKKEFFFFCIDQTHTLFSFRFPHSLPPVIRNGNQASPSRLLFSSHVLSKSEGNTEDAIHISFCCNTFFTQTSSLWVSILVLTVSLFTQSSWQPTDILVSYVLLLGTVKCCSKSSIVLRASFYSCRGSHSSNNCAI